MLEELARQFYHPEYDWNDCQQPVYITFSLNYLHNLFPHRLLLSNTVKSAEELDLSSIRRIKELFTKEWVEKAGMDVKFLADEPFLGEYPTNILLICANEILPVHNAAAITQYSLRLKYETVEETHDVFFKTIVFKKNVVEDNKLFSYIALHEGSHALLAAMDLTFVPEGNEYLDCSSTVMANLSPTECPLRTPNSTLATIKDKMPDTLSEFDLLLVKNYQNQCRQRKKIVSDSEIAETFTENEVVPTTEVRSKIPPTVLPPREFVSPTVTSPTVTPSYKSKIDLSKLLIEQLGNFAQHFGNSFIQSFFYTLIDCYIRPMLISQNQEIFSINLLCSSLKSFIDAGFYTPENIVFNSFIQNLPLALKQVGCSEQQVNSIQQFLLPAFNIGITLKDSVTLDKMLTKLISVPAGTEAGKKFAWLLISKLPKLKQEEPSLLPIFRANK